MYKLIKRTRNKRPGGTSLQYFFKKYIPSEVEIQCKKNMYLSFDFGWYSIHFDNVR